ncbi:hypothetical protein EPICR_160029 [Candidatus Desulfarcum epimagneticum]|uniref:Uncharacterized protein n=1 Tax=uncultured Desulfobacteraceae bacterium TaxID=218296 RepID=A0A484HJH8_9BACT|nr:hypothetical protein EPICR_160029 [uncultured Desulfobacteraceae bacterium]
MYCWVRKSKIVVVNYKKNAMILLQNINIKRIAMRVIFPINGIKLQHRQFL